MKKIYFIVLAIILSIIANAQINLENGLVAYYPFNENTNDESGNDNNGTKYGATWTTDAKVGSHALSFDGGGYVNIPNSTSLTNLSSYTFVTWLNMPNPSSNYNPIFFKGSGSESDIEIYGGNSGITIVHNRNNGGTIKYVYANSIPANEWVHFAVTYSSGVLKTYINGVNDQTFTDWLDPVSHTYPVDLGRLTSFDTYYLNGKMDEVVIYNRALNQLEVSKLYAECKPIVDLEDGLISYYPFTGNANNAADTIFNGLEMNGISLTKDRLGNENQAYHFDGIDDHIRFNPDSSIIQTPHFTISAWARMIGPGGGSENQNPIFEQRSYNNGTQSTILLETDDGTGRAYFAVRGYESNANIVSCDRYEYNTWHHYVATVDSNSVKLFIDGQLKDATEFTTGTNYTQYINNIEIGMHRYEGVNRGLFNGDIDEVRIYNRALDELEIQVLYKEILLAEFEADTTIGIAPATINFTDNSYADDNITSWQWDFNNDDIIDSEEQNPSWIYNESGVYDVKLIVSDGTHVDSIIKESFINIYDPNEDLLRYYNLDGNVEDTSGNNTDATIIDSTFAHRNGIANSCYVSDKSNEINVPAIGNWGNHLAISFWFYGNTNNGSQTLFGSRQNGSGATLTNLGCILQPDSTIRFFIASDAVGEPNTYSSDKIKPNDWNHVICIQNREINKNIIILNGEADTVSYTQTPRYKNYPIGFGCWNSGFSSTGGLIGRIDEIRIYNRELAIEEIDYLVNQSFDIDFDNEILAEYDFMGNADDITGNGYNGSVQGAELANDRFGNSINAYYFNSSETDYIDLGSDLKPAEFPIFVSTWINQDDISGEQVIFRNDDWDTTSVYSGIILKTTDGKISAAYGDSTGNTSDDYYEKTTTDTVIEADTWYHVVVGFLDSEDIVIYVDNQEVSGTYSGTITNIQYKSGNAVFGIGSNETSKFSGNIDDVRIYNRYVDPLEINALFNLADQCPSYNETDVVEICEGSSYTFGTQTLTEAGEYIETFETVLGCDSVVTLTLTVNPVYNITETAEICNGDIYTWEGNDYSTAGTYTTILTTVNGCDSIRELTLTVFAVDTSVTVNQSTLIANATGTYQWIDCSNNQAISGETNQSFTPAQTGDYSVEITQNSCVDTSTCYNIVITSIAENDFGANITVYPNPASDFITVELSELSESYRVTLIDMLGRVLFEDDLTGTSKQINLAAYANGVYFLTVEQTQGIASQHLKSFKIIKK